MNRFQKLVAWKSAILLLIASTTQAQGREGVPTLSGYMEIHLNKVEDLPAEADLVFARKAVVDVLTRGTKEISSPWENPATGARGTVTPVASSYTKDGATCRDFLASYVRRQGAEVWMQGQACRLKQGAWEVKNMRPWSRT